MVPFRDRFEAGRALGRLLAGNHPGNRTLVLALPSGGVPVAYEIAKALEAPLDIFLVRKLGVPGREELAMGAIASGGVRVLNDEVVGDLALGPAAIEPVAVREMAEIDRRERAYRGNLPPPNLRGRDVILVDDGLATGSTMQAAILAIRQQAPARIVVAAPVGALETCEHLRRLADEVVCLSTPEPFRAVGLWYDEFSQTTDEEV